MAPLGFASFPQTVGSRKAFEECGSKEPQRLHQVLLVHLGATGALGLYPEPRHANA